MNNLIAYASRSAKQHHRQGRDSTVPEAVLPDHVQKQVLRDRSGWDLLGQDNSDWERELDQMSPRTKQGKFTGVERNVTFNEEAEEGNFSSINTQRMLRDLNYTEMPKSEKRMSQAQSQYFDARAAGYKKMDMDRTIHQRKLAQQKSLFDAPDASEMSIPIEEEDEISLFGKLTWHFESVTSGDSKILQHVEGSIRNGQVCVVVGDRDSRKDEFLRLLSGRASDLTATGGVFTNDNKINCWTMRAQTSYLAGGQLLIPELTVEESLHFILNFIEKYDTSAEERDKIIDNVMDKVNIAHLKTEYVGQEGEGKAKGLTAEERVRLNLAQILLQQQLVIFLDEPTKGLDLLAADRVISTIISMKGERKIFVSMEHPTRALLYKFDYALFLVRGTQFYYGKADHAGRFFQRLGHPLPEETSVYDHVLSLTRSDKTQPGEKDERNEVLLDVEALLKDARRVFLNILKNPLNDAELKEFDGRRQEALKQDDFISGSISIDYPVPLSQQFVVLLERMQRQFLSDWSRLYLRVLLMLLWAVLLYFVVNKTALDGGFNRGFDIVSSYWLVAFGIEFIMIGNLSDIQEDCLQTQSDMRSNLYHPQAFVLGHILFKIFSMLLLVTPYSILVYYFLGMQENVESSKTVNQYFFMLAMLLMLGTITDSLNTIIGFWFIGKGGSAFYFSALIHTFFVVFSGGVFRWCGVDKIIKGLSFLSPTKYVLEGLLLNNWENVDYSWSLDSCSTTQSGLNWAETNFCTNEFPWLETKNDCLYVLLGYMSFFGLIMLHVVQRVRQT